MKMPFYQLQHKQDLIRHFPPNWFTVVMGTGVVALILPSIAVAPQWMWSFGAALWQISIVLFILFSGMYLSRWILYPQADFPASSDEFISWGDPHGTGNPDQWRIEIWHHAIHRVFGHEHHHMG